MTLDPKVFKAYDVRGVVPDELDADGAYRIARYPVTVAEYADVVGGLEGVPGIAAFELASRFTLARDVCR